MTQAPYTKLQAQSDASASSSAGGVGSPPWCMTPATVGNESAQTSSAQAISFRIEDSPEANGLEQDGRAPAISLYPTTEVDEDRIRFRTLVEGNELDRLTDFCCERLQSASDPQSSLRWQTNISISLALQRRFKEAHGLLASASYVASLVSGPPRARYENEFGLVLVEFGRPLLAIERFDRAICEHRGDPLATGQVWNNKAIAKMVLGEESEAIRCAASSIELIKPTNDAASLEEARETLRRVSQFFGGIR